MSAAAAAVHFLGKAQALAEVRVLVGKCFLEVFFGYDAVNVVGSDSTSLALF